MPKPQKFPTLFNDVKTIDISFLKKHGYLKPNQIMSGTISWSINGNNTGRISIVVNTKEITPFLELDYKCNNEPINYKVLLIDIPSNLGKGNILLFQCPQTKKLCRKLYLVDTYFFHRSAFKDCMYQSQTYSDRNRDLLKQFDIHHKAESLGSQMFSKYFKTHYAGKPTKKFLKILNAMEKTKNTNLKSIEELLMM